MFTSLYTHSLLKSNGLNAMAGIQNGAMNHKRIFSIALGYLLSCDLNVPPQDVEDPIAFFRMNHQVEVMEIINTINELLPHALKQTMEDTKAFYSYRCSVLHPTKIPVVFDNEKAVESFFGLTRNIPPEIMTAISNEAVCLTSLISKLNVILEDIKSAKNQQGSDQRNESVGAVA